MSKYGGDVMVTSKDDGFILFFKFLASSKKTLDIAYSQFYCAFVRAKLCIT